MNLLKKYLYIILFSSICLFFILSSSYLQWIHTPYTNETNTTYEVLNKVLKNNDFIYSDYFYKYVEDDSYYIGKFLVNNRTVYIAFDNEGIEVDRYTSSVYSKDEVNLQFTSKYGVEANEVEIGYSNGSFFYFVKYVSNDVLIYAYYDLRTGEFTKGQML